MQLQLWLNVIYQISNEQELIHRFVSMIQVISRHLISLPTFRLLFQHDQLLLSILYFSMQHFQIDRVTLSQVKTKRQLF